jgi:hypothetical protein
MAERFILVLRPVLYRFIDRRVAGPRLASCCGLGTSPDHSISVTLWRLNQSIFGGTTEIMKEIIGRGLGL